MKRKISYLIISICILVIWQFASNANNGVRLLISSPLAITQYFRANYIGLLLAGGITLFESVSGLIIATAFGLSVMIFCFYNPKVTKIILPIMITFQVIPLIVLAPFFTIFLGIGLSSKITMAALMSFFPIFINFSQGYKAIPGNIHELMNVYDASLKFKIKNVYFPLSMPSIFAGLKVSANLAVIGAIVAEFSGTRFGIGKNLYISGLQLEPELMMSSLLLAVVFGLGLYNFIRLIEKRMVNWI